MATTTQNYQIIQKIAANEYLLLHPETDAEVVQVAATGITATTVKAALEELKGLIDAITSGGVVTGIKGNAESTYRTGQVNITKANIGLGNVDNTSDVNKPVSTAQQTALNLKEDKSALKALAYKDSLTKSDVGLGNVTNDAQVKRTEMGVASGVATLGTDGKVPSSQLPSYVDDVLEADTKSAFPTTGESGKIYVDKSTNLSYRWSGSTYVEISPSIALGETSSTAYAGDKGKANADAIAALQTRATNIEATNAGQSASIDNIISGTQTVGKTKGTAKFQIASINAATDAVTETTVTFDGSSDTSVIGDLLTPILYAHNATYAECDMDGNVFGDTYLTRDEVYSNDFIAANAIQLADELTITLTGDATGSVNYGMISRALAVTLANSGVTAGSYSAVTVDAKGRVTAGAQMIEVGTSGQTTPSSSLAVGGLFFKQV